MILVLMGVSGSGKTAIGTLLAERMGARFADADDFHSPANKKKMAAGHPLDDDDRAPWLDSLHTLLRHWFDEQIDGILACSALKEKYRTTLIGGMPPGTVRFVLLEISREIISKRMASRSHEYMNPALLDSQIATLEVPQDALRITNDRSPEEVVEQIQSELKEKDPGKEE